MPSDNFSRPTGGRKPVRRVNKGPARKVTPPRTDAQSGGGYRFKPTPPPKTWTHPLTPAFPTKTSKPSTPHRPPAPVKYKGRTPTYAVSPAQAVRRADRQARARAARDILRGARGDVRFAQGKGPRHSLTPLFVPPPMQIGPMLRDSGVANNQGSTYRGVVLSPQQIQADMRRVMRGGDPVGKQPAIERLQAAGVVDPLGTTTFRQQRVASRQVTRAQRKQLEAAAWELQRIQNANDANVAVSKWEFDRLIRGVPTSVLAERVQELSRPENLQRAGFNPTQLGGLILGTAQGLSDAARAVTGDSLVGNAANDILMWPTWAVPAAYTAATRPGDFAKGLTEGVIGHAVRGDWKGVGDAFRQHPVFGLAEVRGGASLGGRAITGPARFASRGRVFGTQRAPLNLTGLDRSSAAKLRSFSRDPITMAGQKIADRALTRPGLDVRVAGRGRVPARVLKTDLPVIGRALEAQRRHGVQRLTDYNRAQGVTAQQTLRDGAIETVRLSRIDSPLGRRLARILDLPARPSGSGQYEGVLGRLAARAAEKAGVGRLATDPSAMMVSLVQRGLIRSEIVHPDGTRSRATAKSVADDLDFRIRELEGELARPGAYRTLPDWQQAAAHVEFLRGVRDSGRGLTHVVDVARRLAPEFKKNTDELVRLRALDKDAAERAPLFPGAMTHLGAEYSSLPVRQLREQEKALNKQARSLRSSIGRLGREEQRHLGRTADVLTPQASRAIRAADEEVAAAARTRSEASKELTAANRNYRNAHEGARGLYTDEQRAASLVRRSNAQAAVKASKDAYAEAVASFEARVDAAIAKRQRGEKLTTAERRLVQYERVPARRLAQLEAVRGRKEGARADLAGVKERADVLRARQQAAGDASLHLPGGAALSNDAILAALRARGVDPELIAHLPHQPLGQGAYYKQSGESRRNADTHALTGSMHKRGESAFDWDHVEASLVHGRTLAANIRTLDQFVSDLGVRVGDGSWKETVRVAQNEMRRDRKGNLILDKAGRPIPKYVAMRRMGSRLDPDRREDIAGIQNVTDAPLAEALIDERLKPPAKDGPDVAVLVPFEAIERAREHVKGGGATVANFQALTGQFRQTVLPFSTKWLFGNVAEAILRTAMVTANPLDRRTARLALDRMIAEDALASYGNNPQVRQAAQQLLQTNRTLHPQQVRALRRQLLDYAPNAHAAEMELIGGLFFGARGQTVHRTADEMGPAGASVAAMAKLPVIHEYLAMTRWLGRKVFALNRALEREAQLTVLGKHVRNEIQDFTGRWQTGIRLSQRGLDDFSKGLLGTPAQLKAANWLDETLGRYSRFSPTTRKWIQTYMPFLPWYLNAVRFTMLTIPFKHPIKFALWTSAERTFEQDWAEQHKDIPPDGYGDFRASIATKDGGYKLGITQATPFGLLGPIGGRGDLGDFASLLLPQFSGVQATLRGKNPFGEDMALPQGKTLGPLDYAQLAAYGFLESVVPGLNMARRLQERGGQSLATSTVWNPQIKPGSEGNKGRGESAVSKVFNAPFRSTYLREGTSQTTAPPSSSSGSTGRALQSRISEALRTRKRTGPSLQSRISEALRNGG